MIAIFKVIEVLILKACDITTINHKFNNQKNINISYKKESFNYQIFWTNNIFSDIWLLTLKKNWEGYKKDFFDLLYSNTFDWKFLKTLEKLSLKAD